MQPIGLEYTTTGARNRAIAAWKASSDCDIAFGIESGLFKLSNGKYYDVCVCSAFDGQKHHLGFSCAFQIPSTIICHVLEHGKDLSQACNMSGITSDPRLGEHGGLIGILTHSRINRSHINTILTLTLHSYRLKYTKQAITCALLFVEEAKWFS